MRRQEGAALVMVALSTTALALTFGLVANVGLLLAEHTRMQAAADAAALAGARALADGADAAEAQAIALAQANGYTVRAENLAVGTDRVHVGWQQGQDLLLGSLLDRLGVNLAISADAQLVPQCMRYGLRPFAIPKVPQDLVPGHEYPIKVGCECSPGNFQALALEGPGAASFRTTIEHGSSRRYEVGQTVETEPGDMVGPTRMGVQALIGQDATPYAQAVEHPERTPRVLTVCLVDPAEWARVHGRDTVHIAHFAQFYVTRTDSSGGVWARFMRCPDLTSVPGTGYQYTAKLID